MLSGRLSRERETRRGRMMVEERGERVGEAGRESMLIIALNHGNETCLSMRRWRLKGVE